MPSSPIIKSCDQEDRTTQAVRWHGHSSAAFGCMPIAAGRPNYALVIAWFEVGVTRSSILIGKRRTRIPVAGGAPHTVRHERKTTPPIPGRRPARVGKGPRRSGDADLADPLDAERVH